MERRWQEDNNLNKWKSVIVVGDQDDTNWFYLLFKSFGMRLFSVQYIFFSYIILSRKNIVNWGVENLKTTLSLVLTFFTLRCTGSYAYEELQNRKLRQ